MRVATGSFSKPQVPYHERYCQCYNTNDIEDVYHLLLSCPAYVDARAKLIKPSIQKCIELLKLENETIVKKTAIFVKIGLDLSRLQLLK